MDFVPLKITTVKAGKELTFDLYILYKDTFLCYAPMGQTLDEEKLEKLASQDMADFFIPRDQIDSVNTFLDESLKMALCATDISDDEKAELVEGVAGSAIEQMQAEGSAESYSMTQKAASGLRELVNNNPHALKRFFGDRRKESDQIINHCINVCGLSCKLAQHIGLPEDDINDLATAALIHDIGITFLRAEVVRMFEAPRESLKGNDALNYYEHIKAAGKLLEDKPFISKQVEELIMNHEENLQGTGPLKLQKLTPLQECLNLVNVYDKRVFTNKETPAEAYKSFQIDNIGLYNLELIQRFGMVLKEEGLLELSE